MGMSKLERAIREHAEGLTEAQRELVLSQFSVYKRNKARMEELKDATHRLNGQAAATREEVRAKQAERSVLSTEYNQLAQTNSRISAELFNFLGD